MNEFQKRDPGTYTGPDPEPEAMEVVEGEVGSARLKEPSEVELEGRRRSESERLPEALLGDESGEDHTPGPADHDR